MMWEKDPYPPIPSLEKGGWGDFSLGVKIAICLFRHLIEAILQKEPFLLDMGTIPMGIDLNGFPPDEDSSRKRIGEKETIPCMKNGLLGGTKGDRKDWFPRQSGQFNHTDLGFVTRSSWSIWNDHDIRSILKGFDHLLEARETFASA